MSSTQLTIRTDEATKTAIAQFAKKLGLSTSAFVMAATREAMENGRVTLSAPLEPTPYLKEIIEETERDIAEGKNIQTFDNPDDLVSHLRSL
jgi:antitoxin component of RelBE/YafQ-DinJ toxin-antitoxin module